MRCAVIYERNNEWYVASSSKTAKGLWIDSPPFVRIGKDEPNCRKRDVIIAALNASREGIPDPETYDGVIRPLLDLTGAKSWAEFMKRAKYLAVELDAEHLKVIPHKRVRRPRGALESMPDKELCVSINGPPEEFGSALDEGMRRST